MQRLVAERFIDDSRFARLFVRDRLRFASWGERKILMALRQKGIDEATAETDACRMEHVISPESFAAIKAHVTKNMK